MKTTAFPIPTHLAMESREPRPYVWNRLNATKKKPLQLPTSSTPGVHHSYQQNESHGYSVSGSIDAAPEMHKRSADNILIAVCGMTGIGKSTFVGKASGKPVKVGHGLKSRKCALLHSDSRDPEPVEVSPNASTKLHCRGRNGQY